MGNSITKSLFLNYLLADAEAFRKEKSNKSVTANHIFAAVLKYYRNNVTVDGELDALAGRGYDRNEVEAVFNLVKNYLVHDDFDATLNTLCVIKDTTMDDYLFRQNMVFSERAASQTENSIFSADILIKSIISSPTDEIRLIIQKAEAKKRSFSPEAVSRMLDDMTALLSAKDSSKSSAPPTPSTPPTASTATADAVARELSKPSTAHTPDTPAPPEADNGSASGTEAIPVQDAEGVTGNDLPKDELDALTRKVKIIQRKLSDVIFGQDYAINVFASGYFQAELQRFTDKTNKKPKATFLFAGPPGVGKTFLAEQAASLLELPYKRFDMSEYSGHDAQMELCGTNESYKGSKEGALTGFVKRNPECVILFDEIEKAGINAINLFLQILDAGRLRDTYTSAEVDFSKTILIFTTNAGKKLYEGSPTFNLSHIPRKTILRALEKSGDYQDGTSSFPAAICSRFATGNVVMFNHMEAHILRSIAEKEILSCARGFEKEAGIKCNISDNVYSCILFAEGGLADARTVKSRANTFLSSELYELFRLVSIDSNGYEIQNIETINIDLVIPEDNEEVARLFRRENKASVMVFASDSVRDSIVSAFPDDYTVTSPSSFDEAVALINKNDYDLILCDLHAGTKDKGNNLSIEDIDSEGSDFFRYACEMSDIPLYIVSDEEHRYSEEEMFSLLKEGARGEISVTDKNTLLDAVAGILDETYQQASMDSLAKSNKIVTFRTAQSISADLKTANIRLYGIDLEIAVDGDDSESILNAVSKPNVRFGDIIGAESAKEELQYFVNYLKNPKAFSNRGLGVPKGVLFYGPPGTGKTMLAKAVAGESDVTFIFAEGNQFKKKYVGEGEEAVHRLFATARKYAPSIIFIDEIDAIAKERTGSEFSAASESILTAFLSEMDGFKTDAKRPVFVLAATNFEVEPGTKKSLDPALLRRFDRHIYIDLPDKNARIKFIKMKISKSEAFSISENEIENIAVRSTGMSLAQLASVFQLSLRIAIRKNKTTVDDEVFEEAFETFNYGEEKKWDISHIRKTAYHEAGHAFLCWHGGETPSYLTIVARGNHGGYMLHGDNESQGTYTKKMLLNRIRTSLGGRAAELVFFGEDEGLSTGPSSDLRTATAIARSIVCNYGMDETMGLAVISESEATEGFLAQQIRDAVNNILKTELDNAKELLIANRAAVDKIVEVLLVKNHLSSEEINDIFSAYSTQGE